MKKLVREWGWVLYVVAFVALLVFSVWAWFAGPCWIWSFSKLGEIPARCILELSRP